MRKYKGKGELESVWCNWCGKRLIVKDGILREGSAHFELTWDYFSEKMCIRDRRNTRGVTGFVGPGSKPVPLTEDEMANLGFKPAGVVVDYEVGDAVVVISGAWKDTVGVIKSINDNKQTLEITVEMFGRETPVELDFTEVKKM